MSAYNMPDDCNGLPKEDLRVSENELDDAKDQLIQYIESAIAFADYKELADLASNWKLNLANDIFVRADEVGVNDDV